jgi:predicted lysophospholipase L1 biosynthesis ABC-type transport system permease subunit
MVSENLARELWGTPSAAIGKRLREFPKMPWHEVIGVIQDVREKGVQETAPEIVYWPPLTENLFGSGPAQAARTMTFVIRSERAGSESFVKQVHEAVWSVNSNLPLASIRTMRNVYEKSLARTSFTLVMLGIAAAMALVLGIIGIYGVMSYTVSQRQREIGIRLALGAQRGHVLQMVLQQGTKLAVVGVTIGISAGLGLTRLLRHLLFGVTAQDPLTFAVVSSLLILIVLVACYIPARRATLLDPVVAIRYE